jgi:mannose-1-phosphate guanylyltransferase
MDTSPTKAIILAAGKGNRLSPLTDAVPKPMLSVGGKPLLERTISRLKSCGVTNAAINLHHLSDVIVDHFADGKQYGIDVKYSYEPELLGTAGAVKKLSQFIGNDRFFLIYGDNLSTCDLRRLADFHREHKGIGTMALFWRKDVSHSGLVELAPSDRIIRFVEKPAVAQDSGGWVNAGIFVWEPEVLEFIPNGRPSDFGFEVLPPLMKSGLPFYGYKMGAHEGLWWIDTLEDYKRVCEMWKNGSPS